MSIEAYYRRRKAQPAESLASRYSDVALAGGVVAIVAMMIVPLPALALDALVALNIAIGVGLVLVAIYVGSVTEFAAFPSVLLITTLYRLALSIATTRMILLEGHAGHIIDAFGTMVAGGNLVVGLVVFLIITVVQFIVIAKGAERVAEVAARFSLDAMPGKQLSIDSDLRSGLIDKEEAKRKRKHLELESKLHGSLDGAMKFVKGDAMAGIIIVVVNLLGGLAVGVLQQGMELGAAVQKYSILTIGDGLVMQIPALLGAMAAGLLVTRTGDDERERHLGDALRRQLAEKPRVFLVAGAVCWLLAFVPGFPMAVFLVLGGAAMVTGIMLDAGLRRRIDRKVRPGRATAEKVSTEAAVTRAGEVKPVVPLLLELDGAAARSLDPERLGPDLEEVLERFELDLGVVLPRIAWCFAETPGETGWRLLAYEAPIGAGALDPTDPAGCVAAGVREALRRHVGLFVGIQEASAILTRAGADYPEVVKEVARALPLARIAEVLRRLVEEEVPLRNVRDILESLADAGQREKDAFALTEFARVALRRQISHRHAVDGVLRAVTVDSALEQTLRDAVRNGAAGGPQLSLDPETAKAVLDGVVAQVRATGVGVVLTAIDVRRHLRKLIEPDLFDVAVLSFHELLPTLKLDIVGRVEPAPSLTALPQAEAA